MNAEPVHLDHSNDEPVIRVNGVSRWFGSVVAVSDVSFDVRPGITGLLGPNGAGKTTLFRMITGLAATSTGTITVFGQPVRDNPSLYARLGVMSEHETVYGFMTGREFVSAMAKLRGVRDVSAATDRAIARVDLADAQHRRMDTYSRGMRQRMRLAGTLVHDPDVLILDEPLNGADPRQRVHFKRLLQQLATEGRTILISSHILEEVEELAETVLLVVNGKLAASGEFRAIRAALNQRPYHVRVVSDQPRELAAAVVKLASVDAVHMDPDGALVILSRNVMDLQMELPKLAQHQRIRLLRVEPLDDSLESVFGYLVER
ncbi:MAG TPA: ABC transporter ATP-binding protein [Gemmatimonadaceae bacterium]|jgi:ABC-2 type transport system ATP-binding protein